MGPDPQSAPARWERMALVGALVLVAATFARTLTFGFVNWDDDLHVLRNPAVLGGASLVERLLTPSLGYPIPVTVATYAFEHALFGLRPWPYHATNLLLHLASCWLLWRLARRLGLGSGAATAALLIFGLHPVIAEPVSWITGRKDLLAAALALGASNIFLAAPVVGRRRAAAAAALFALAALSKPAVLAVPLAWVVAARSLHGSAWRPALRAAAPALLVACLVAVVGAVGQARVGAVHAVSPGAWLREAWYALGYHQGLLLFLQHPLAKHIPPSMPPPFDARVDLLPLPLLAGLVALWRMRPGRLSSLALVGLAWAGLAYLPSSNLLPLARFLADSYVYLPLAGVALAAAAGLAGLAARVCRPALAAALAVAVAGVLSLASLEASASWRDGTTLWGEVADRYPDSPEVCQNLGNAWFERDLDAALETYRTCARRFGARRFHRNIGVTLFGLHRLVEARREFQDALANDPGDRVALDYLRRIAEQAPGAF